MHVLRAQMNPVLHMSMGIIDKEAFRFASFHPAPENSWNPYNQTARYGIRIAKADFSCAKRPAVPQKVDSIDSNALD